MKSPGQNTFVFSRGFVHLLTRRSAQPVIFNHSSRGLGHGPNKHFAFVYTKALLAGRSANLYLWFCIANQYSCFIRVKDILACNYILLHCVLLFVVTFFSP